MPKKVTITPAVREVLGLATVEGTADRPVIKLNQPGLPRDLYVDTDKVLRALGGKWDRRAQGHVFSRPVEGELAEALSSGIAVDQARTAEQFFTPPAVAQRIWHRARVVGGEHVLEPSAGEGALLTLPISLGCFITAVERDQRLAADLSNSLVEVHGCGVWCADFLQWSPTARAPIDVVLMNPPFSRGQDTAHVLRALSFLRPGGRLVAVMSTHWVFATDRAANDFRVELSRLGDDRYEWEELPPGSFKPSGAGVSAGLLTIHKGN